MGSDSIDFRLGQQAQYQAQAGKEQYQGKRHGHGDGACLQRAQGVAAAADEQGCCNETQQNCPEGALVAGRIQFPSGGDNVHNQRTGIGGGDKKSQHQDHGDQ